MTARRLLTTTLVLVAVTVGAPRPAAAEWGDWWEFIQEMSGPGPFRQGLFSDVESRRLIFRVGLGSNADGIARNPIDTFGNTFARFSPYGPSPDLHFRIDYVPLTGDRTDDGTVVDWVEYGFALERTVFRAGAGPNGSEHLRVFVGGGFSINRFSGDAFDDFDVVGLNLAMGAMVRTGPIFFDQHLGFGAEGGGRGVYLSVDPGSFDLPADAFVGGGELLLGGYLTLFAEFGF